MQVDHIYTLKTNLKNFLFFILDNGSHFWRLFLHVLYNLNHSLSYLHWSNCP